MNKTTTMLLITLCGLVTSVLTAALLSFIENVAHFALFSFFWLFIIPVGAIISGMIAGTGYYVGSKLTGYRPDRSLLISILLVSIGTYFLLYGMNYYSESIDGVPLRTLVSFPEYMHTIITTSQFTIGHSSSSSGIALGGFAYIFAVLEVAGFACGGLIIHGIIASLPYCENCSTYLSHKETRKRYTADAEAIQPASEKITGMLKEGRITQAMSEFSLAGNEKSDRSSKFRASWIVHFCKKCNRHWYKFQLEQKGKDNYTNLPQFGAEAKSEYPV
jgi:hypothetical protein